MESKMLKKLTTIIEFLLSRLEKLSQLYVKMTSDRQFVILKAQKKKKKE